MDSNAKDNEYVQIAVELAAIQRQILQPTTLTQKRYAELMLQRHRLIRRFWPALLAFGVESVQGAVERQAVEQFRGIGPMDGWTTYSPPELIDEQLLQTYEEMHQAAVQGRPYDPGFGTHTRIA